MKTIVKYFTAIVLLNIQIATYSQNFISENKEWAVLAIIEPSEPPSPYVTTYYKFSGDSIFNGKTYHKLYQSTDSNQVNWTLNSLWYERNDSIFRFYSQYGSSNDTNILVYNFNIEEGDSFKYSLNYMKVDSIRYLEWGGSIRKHWFFCRTNSDTSAWNRTIWIEGIGQFGLFTLSSDMEITGASIEFLCFHENGNLIYQNPKYNSCFIKSAVPSFILSDEIDIFPNPASDYLMIKLNNAQLLPLTFQLFDMQGIPKLDGKISNEQIGINVASLSKGLYELKIITNQQIETKKVILQ